MSGSVATYGALQVRTFSTEEAMARGAAADIAQTIVDAGEGASAVNVMFATGNSQLAMLDSLITVPGVPWDKVRIFHMDQYVDLDPEHPASFSRYIRDRLVDRVAPLAAHYVDGTPAGAPAYAQLLARYPLDLCVMGVGENGHLAFNDPPVADFEDPLDVKVVALDAECRRQQVGEGHFPTIDDVPTHAVTVTIPALLRARSVVVVCPEARKAPAVAAALKGPISTACPASVLRQCGHARLYLDAGAASLL